MKKALVSILVAGTLCLGVPALAHDATIDDRYEDGVTHPLRIAYYVIHPVGFAAEWLIARPFQYVISREQLRNIFGYRPLTEEATYKSIGEQPL